MDRRNEAQEKISALRSAFLENGKYAGIAITEQPNFSYLTSGARGFLGLSSVKACASLLITKQKVILISNNIESGRLLREELPDGLCECVISPWWREDLSLAGAEEVAGGVCLSDSTLEVSRWLGNRRLHLTPEEIERYRSLCGTASAKLEWVLREIPPGLSEFEIAGRLSASLWGSGVEPISLFVAADDRINHVRHYIPTEKKAFHSVTASICARKHGLVASVTRSMTFSAATKEQQRGHEALMEVERRLWDALKPGEELASIYRTFEKAYGDAGLEQEWKNHHQGGLTGYLPREIKIDESTGGIVECGTAYAFNPSCPYAKLEDTVLLTEHGIEILSRSGNWPEKQLGGRLRPEILVRVF